MKLEAIIRKIEESVDGQIEAVVDTGFGWEMRIRLPDATDVEERVTETLTQLLKASNTKDITPAELKDKSIVIEVDTTGYKEVTKRRTGHTYRRPAI
ncbi:unnamed protein product [marine sediment metagenome]|uniref:Uncharacterized protein n=1 Tax=marine sediment metagenome TaxID=412755 RepID=X1RDG6_9ZZZZ